MNEAIALRPDFTDKKFPRLTSIREGKRICVNAPLKQYLSDKLSILNRVSISNNFIKEEICPKI